MLAGGLDRTGFSALRGALAGKRTEMEHHRNTMELGAARLAELRGVVLERVVQFNDTVRLLRHFHDRLIDAEPAGRQAAP